MPLKHYILYLKHVNTQRKFCQSCRWGVAPRRTSFGKQVGRRRRDALVVASRWGGAAPEPSWLPAGGVPQVDGGIANAVYWKRTLSSPHSSFLSLHPSFSSFLSLPLTFTLTI